MANLIMQSALVGLTALALSPALCSAQTRPPVNICVVAAGRAPDCLRDPIPSILDDSTASRPRTYEYRGDGSIVPYRSR